MAKGSRNAGKLNQAGSTRGPRFRNGKGSLYGGGSDKRTFVAKERDLGGGQVEGRQSVKELLYARKRKVREIWISDSVERVGIVADILDLAMDLRVPVVSVARTRLDSVAGSEGSQGVVAFCEKLTESSLGELAQTKKGVRPFLVILDGVTDPYNLGAILRSADCAGVTGVIVPEHRSVHVTPSATKSAAGAIEHLRLAMVPGISSALTELSKAGVWSVGLDADADQSIYQVNLFDQPVAIVVGAEGKGLSPLVKQRCDVLASIPLYGHVPSLNVSNAAALAMFQAAQVRAN